MKTKIPPNTPKLRNELVLLIEIGWCKLFVTDKYNHKTYNVLA